MQFALRARIGVVQANVAATVPMPCPRSEAGWGAKEAVLKRVMILAAALAVTSPLLAGTRDRGSLQITARKVAGSDLQPLSSQPTVEATMVKAAGCGAIAAVAPEDPVNPGPAPKGLVYVVVEDDAPEHLVNASRPNFVAVVEGDEVSGRLKTIRKQGGDE